MRRLWLLTLLLISLPCFGAENISGKVFRFHLVGEPYSLDPALMRGSSGSYLFNNIHRSLFRYHPEKGLVPEGAKSCEWQSNLQLRCRLNPEMKWSDGSDIEAKHYVTAFRRLADPETKTVQTELLLPLKNAAEILKGEKPAKSLGVYAQGKKQLIFAFAKKDLEFLYKLTAPTLAPIKSLPVPSREEASELISNGPYVIEKWDKGHFIRLKPNPHYPSSSRPRHPVEVLFIDDDSTALRLYETGKLSLLRRLVTAQIPVYKDREDFLQIPMARFDYVGFAPSITNKHMRKALAHALNYKQLQKLYHALGTPGCPSLPKEYMDQPICYDFDLKKAKAAWAKVPDELKSKRWKLAFSKMGGDDILKGMEWIQNQWKKHLGAHIELQPVEQGMYIQTLRVSAPPLFRKGLGLDRPTCLAALEIFEKGHRENYIGFTDEKYEEVLKQLRSTQDEKQTKILCRKGVERLLKQRAMIPLGEIHFTMLARPQWKGWFINEMNQLDLTELSWSEQ